VRSDICVIEYCKIMLHNFLAKSKISFANIFGRPFVQESAVAEMGDRLATQKNRHGPKIGKLSLFG